jgi:hypothetical protein
MVKAASPARVRAPGGKIRYQFTLTNTGNVTLTGAAVSDPELAAAGITVRCPHTVLAPGASEVCAPSKPYTTTRADAARGRVVNTADADGKTSLGHLIRSRPSTVTTALSAQPIVIPTGEGASAAPPGASPGLAAAGAAALAAGTALLTRRRTRRRA